MKVVFGMAITSAAYFSETEAELLGLWYFSENYVPSTKEEKRQIFSDLIRGRCVQLCLNGTFKQVQDLLLQSDIFRSGSPKAIEHFVKVSDILQKYPAKHIRFEDPANPNGTSYCIDALCDVDETIESIRTKVHSRAEEIQIQIAGSWN